MFRLYNDYQRVRTRWSKRLMLLSLIVDIKIKSVTVIFIKGII